MLFERFDRLLFLAKGGRTIYYGPLGEKSHHLIEYLEENGAPKYPKGDNPAQWILSVIGAAPGSHTDIDWHQQWRASPQYQEVCEDLARLKRDHQRPQSTRRTNRMITKYNRRSTRSFRLVLACNIGGW